MNKTKLLKFIDAYKKVVTPSDLDDRRERVEYYQSFDKKKVLAMSYEDFTAFISTLWASLMYGNKKYLVDKIISSNDSLDKVKKMLAEFLFGNGKLEDRWDTFYKEAAMFGPSYMSELLSYYYPNDFVITNSQVVKALDVLEVSGMPHYNSQWSGKKYLEVCQVVKEIGDELQKNGVIVENLLSVDYFLWEVAKEYTEPQATKEEKKAEEPKPIKQKSYHDEIIEKLVDIGNCLGFEAEPEVKVATGAVVDAVWKVKIGNMGMIMYVFEVQSHGSIDSLILNLQKANNNKAVQRLVAVSDTKQLQKIKAEADSINGLDIVLWDFEDVEMVHESLNNAFSSINKLGLVPPDFVK